jgi:hypothetical protein
VRPGYESVRREAEEDSNGKTVFTQSKKIVSGFLQLVSSLKEQMSATLSR